MYKSRRKRISSDVFFEGEGISPAKPATHQLAFYEIGFLCLNSSENLIPRWKVISFTPAEMIRPKRMINCFLLLLLCRDHHHKVSLICHEPMSKPPAAFGVSICYYI